MWSFTASRSDFRHKKHLVSFSGRTVHDSGRMGESWGSFGAGTCAQSRTSRNVLVNWLAAQQPRRCRLPRTDEDLIHQQTDSQAPTLLLNEKKLCSSSNLHSLLTHYHVFTTIYCIYIIRTARLRTRHRSFPTPHLLEVRNKQRHSPQLGADSIYPRDFSQLPPTRISPCPVFRIRPCSLAQPTSAVPRNRPSSRSGTRSTQRRAYRVVGMDTGRVWPVEAGRLDGNDNHQPDQASRGSAAATSIQKDFQRLCEGRAKGATLYHQSWGIPSLHQWRCCW